jgi:hypothetical protein
MWWIYLLGGSPQDNEETRSKRRILTHALTKNGSIDAPIDRFQPKIWPIYLRLIDWSSHFWLNRKLRSLQSLRERIVQHNSDPRKNSNPGNVQSTSVGPADVASLALHITTDAHGQPSDIDDGQATRSRLAA